LPGASARTRHVARDSPCAGAVNGAFAAPVTVAPRASIDAWPWAIGWAVRFVTTDTRSAWSPATRKRGPASRATMSFVTSARPVPLPTSVASVAPRPVMRHVVRLSGQRSATLARPSAPVETVGAHSATSRKSRRGSSRPPLSKRAREWTK